MQNIKNIFKEILDSVDEDQIFSKGLDDAFETIEPVIAAYIENLGKTYDYFKLSTTSKILFRYIIMHFILYAWHTNNRQYLNIDSLLEFVFNKNTRDFTDMINSYRFMKELHSQKDFEQSVKDLKQACNLFAINELTNSSFRERAKAEDNTRRISELDLNIDFSDVPEFEISLAKRYADYIKFDERETKTHKLGIEFPKILCDTVESFKKSCNEQSKTSFIQFMALKNESLYESCQTKINEKTLIHENYSCYYKFDGLPCRLWLTAAYKWMNQYKLTEYEDQRAKYFENKDEIDSKRLFLTNRLTKLCTLPENMQAYPRISKNEIDLIRKKIDDAELSCNLYKNEPNIIYVYNISNNACEDIKVPLQEFKDYLTTGQSTDYLFECKYLFILLLLKTDLKLYQEYVKDVVDYNNNFSVIKGNSYYGYVAGNDRDEVKNEVEKLINAINFNFELDPNYIKITALDLMCSLADGTERAIRYSNLEYGKIYLITGLKEFIKVYLNKDDNIYKVKTRIFDHFFKQITRFDDNKFIVLAGQKSEIEDFLALDPALKILFAQNTVIINDKTNEELYDIFKEKIEKKSKIELTEENKNDFINYVAYNRGSFPFDNTTLAAYLANFVVSNDEFVLPTNLSIIKETNFMKELDNLVGMNQIKEQVKSLYDFARYKKAAEEQNIKIGDGNLHMVFTGNPGTGKTTVARILAKAFYDIGIIKENKLVEVEAKDLIAKYVGHTAPQTQEVIDKAMGGVLFIDEAYSIVGNNYTTIHGDNYGSECISTLITAMENHKGDFICIFAGYKLEMEKFIDSNPGLKSRIGYVFHFDDYSVDELLEIFNRKIKSSNLIITDDCIQPIKEIIQYFASARNIGNGRFINKLYQIILQKKSKVHDSNIQLITKACIPSIQEIIDILPDKDDLVSPDQISDEEKLRVTYHEIGHALANIHFNIPVKSIKVIVSANGSLGYTQSSKDQIKNCDENDFRNLICISLAGVACEQVMLGKFASGGASDFEKATAIIKHMIQNGLSSYGFSGYFIIDRNLDISAEINKIMSEEFTRAMDILSKQKDKIENISKILLEKGIVENDELKKLLKSI